MIDHDIRSHELIARVFDGKTEGLSREDILDNVTLYWLTNNTVSSPRGCTGRTSSHSSSARTSGSLSPSASFPMRSGQRRGAGLKRRNPNLIHFNKLAKGAHFNRRETFIRKYDPDVCHQRIRPLLQCERFPMVSATPWCNRSVDRPVRD